MNPRSHSTEARRADGVHDALGSGSAAIDVVAASITVLRCGRSAPPELIWTPEMPCAWRMQIDMGPGLISLEAPSRTEPEQHGPVTVAAEVSTYTWRAGRAVAGTTVSIEHRDQRLLDKLVETGNRRLRIMAWTTQALVGHARTTTGDWARITVDELVYEQTRCLGGTWLSELSTVVLTPLLDVTAPPGR